LEAKNGDDISGGNDQTAEKSLSTSPSKRRRTSQTKPKLESEGLPPAVKAIIEDGCRNWPRSQMKATDAYEEDELVKCEKAKGFALHMDDDTFRSHAERAGPGVPFMQNLLCMHYGKKEEGLCGRCMQEMNMFKGANFNHECISHEVRIRRRDKLRKKNPRAAAKKTASVDRTPNRIACGKTCPPCKRKKRPCVVILNPKTPWDQIYSQYGHKAVNDFTHEMVLKYKIWEKRDPIFRADLCELIRECMEGEKEENTQKPTQRKKTAPVPFQAEDISCIEERKDTIKLEHTQTQGSDTLNLPTTLGYDEEFEERMAQAKHNSCVDVFW